MLHTMTLREVLALQRETVLIAVTMTVLIVVFSGGRSGILQTGLITVIDASIAGNMVRFAVPVVARRFASLPQPQCCLALLLALGLIGVVAGSVAILVLFGVSEAFGLFTRVEGQHDEFARTKEIQLGLLPKTLPVLPGYASAGHWQPARMIGGDYYDLWRIDEDHAGLCIVTLFVAMLDLRSGTLVHANAGHNAPLLRRAARSDDAGAVQEQLRRASLPFSVPNAARVDGRAYQARRRSSRSREGEWETDGAMQARQPGGRRGE
jgi:hypothetical protein